MIDKESESLKVLAQGVPLLTHLVHKNYSEVCKDLHNKLCLTSWDTMSKSEIGFYLLCFHRMSTAIMDDPGIDISSYVDTIKKIADHIYDAGYMAGQAYFVVAKYLAEKKKSIEALDILICRLLLTCHRDPSEDFQNLVGIRNNVLSVVNHADNIDEILEFVNTKAIFACRNKKEVTVVKMTLSAINAKVGRIYEAARIVAEEIIPSIDGQHSLIEIIPLKIYLISLYKQMGDTYKEDIKRLTDEVNTYTSMKDSLDPIEKELLEVALRELHK